MKTWVTLWANRVGIISSCVTLLANVVLGNAVLISVLRAVVVGFVLYVTMLLLGSLVINALIRLVAEQATEEIEVEASPTAARAAG